LDGRGEAGGRQTTHNDCINGSRGWVFPVWEPIHLMGAVEASAHSSGQGTAGPFALCPSCSLCIDPEPRGQRCPCLHIHNELMDDQCPRSLNSVSSLAVYQAQDLLCLGIAIHHTVCAAPSLSWCLRQTPSSTVPIHSHHCSLIESNISTA
jgi:hypothetical protein